MQVLLLGAGYGKRLLPLTKTFPKPMLPVLNMPAVEYLIRYFSSFGIKNFMINTFHHAKLLEKGIKNIDLEGINVSFSRESELLGTGGGLKRMLRKTKEEFIIISNTDSICNFDLKSLVDAHSKSNSEITLVMIPYKKESDYSKVSINSGGYIEAFHDSERSSKKNEKFGIFTGIHILSKSSLPKLPKERKFCIVEDYYKKLIEKGFKIYAQFAKGDWLDLGDVKKYYHSNLNILKNFRRFKPIEWYLNEFYHKLGENIYIHKKTKLPSHVKLAGPLLIGEKTKIESGCILGPETVIGNFVQIGENSKITKSIILDETTISQRSKIKKMIYYKSTQLKIR